MPFKITITETRTVRMIQRPEWKQIGVKQAELDDRFGRQETGAAVPVTEPVFGYTPEIETLQEVTRDVLEQEVEVLNLIDVIKAINKIP